MTLLDAATAANDIRDIRGPIALGDPFPYGSFAIALLLASALAVAVALVVQRLRRRKPSPYERAKLRVHEATERSLACPADDLAEFVSGAVRDYVEARFALRAAHRTTEEFLSELLRGADEKLAPYRDELARFLGACDVAKFAGSDLPIEQRRELCGDAVRFLDAAEAAISRGGST